VCGVILTHMIGTAIDTNSYAGWIPIDNLYKQTAFYITGVEDEGFNTCPTEKIIRYSSVE